MSSQEDIDKVQGPNDGQLGLGNSDQADKKQLDSRGIFKIELTGFSGGT